MKRIPQPRILSSEHHRALVMARKAKQAGDDAVNKVWPEMEGYYSKELERHFSIEENCIGAPFEKPGLTEVIKQLKREHQQIRSFFDMTTLPDAGRLHDLGKLLEQHVRFEEKVLFNMAQEKLGEEVLDALARACSHDLSH